MKIRKRLGRAFGAALLAGSLGACDYINVSDRDPNIVTEARLDQLWVSAQIRSFLFAEGQPARISAVWTQQLAGTDRQFALLDQYVFGEGELDDEFSGLYTGGGLVDIRGGQAIADSVNCPSCKALFQIHEAYLIGMAASIFGDLPYREAVNEEIENPALDPQQQVYADVQALLDQAIAGLSTAPSGGATAFYSQMAAADLNFAGDRAQWTAVAYTLKARFYMHWVEAQQAGVAAAQTACGGDCIANAQAAAMNGIKTPAGNWRGIHTTAFTENNLFFAFFRERSGYATAGAYLVDLLQERNDPRLPVYIQPIEAEGAFVGSAPGENNSSASVLSLSGVGAPDYNQPIVLCAENQFILAETYYYQGNAAQAQASLEAGVDCQETLFAAYPSFAGGTEIPVPGTPLTGPALLEEIITQKYIALFLNMEALNDYKRTCLPRLQTFNNQEIPRRIFYGRTERQTNTNIAPPDQQPRANANDPQGCQGA